MSLDFIFILISLSFTGSHIGFVFYCKNDDHVRQIKEVQLVRQHALGERPECTFNIQHKYIYLAKLRFWTNLEFLTSNICPAM